MRKTFIGPRLRQLRRSRNQTQAEMAQALGISPAYVNLLENNQRSLSVQVLMTLSDVYRIDWQDLVKDESSTRLAELRGALQDPIFGQTEPDLQELRGAIDHAPGLVDTFLQLYKRHRSAIDRIMRQGEDGDQSNILATSPETIIHDFFRNHRNHFDVLERAAESIRREEACDAHDVYEALKARLARAHGIEIRTLPVEEMSQALRLYRADAGEVLLSEALDHQNRVFQLAHVLCLVEFADALKDLTQDSGIASEAGLARCHVELANYFAAAHLMPYEPFIDRARRTRHDIDRLAAAVGVSFEQVCQRLTTLQREGNAGVPFFFLRVDKAGNVTKRFNSTSFNLAEYGGACPVWNLHSSFTMPGVVLPQFLEMPDGGRFFSISRTTDRPVFSRETQDRRLAIALGCELRHAEHLVYADGHNVDDARIFSPIGINCHICPRQACSQRAHQPLVTELPIDTARRGETRYES